MVLEPGEDGEGLLTGIDGLVVLAVGAVGGGQLAEDLGLAGQVSESLGSSRQGWRR